MTDKQFLLTAAVFMTAAFVIGLYFWSFGAGLVAAVGIYCLMMLLDMTPRP